MLHRSLLAGALLFGACFSSQPKAKDGASTPPTVATAERAPDYSATIADPLGFLPRDSEIVVSVDATQVRDSELWAMFSPRITEAAGDGLATFQAACGFHPLDALRGITVGLQGKAPDVEGVIVVSGFDRTQVMDCLARAAKEPGSDLRIDGGFVSSPVSDGQGAVAFTFVDASTAVISYGKTASKESLQAILASGAPLRTSPAFTEMFSSIDVSSSAWMVVNSRVFDDAMSSVGVRASALFGWVTLRDGVSGTVRVRFADAAQATSLASMAQGQLGAAKAFFDKLEVAAEGNDFVLQLGMTTQQLSTLASMLSSLAGAP